MDTNHARSQNVTMVTIHAVSRHNFGSFHVHLGDSLPYLNTVVTPEIL